jgi:DNA-binding CsgD family transcriptional regulator
VTSQAAQELTRVLGELQQLHRELVEQRYVRRSDGVERIGEALRRLGEIGSPAGIIARSAEELGTSSDLDLVLVSRLEDGHIRPHALWVRGDHARAEAALAELASRSMPLGYPLIEAEVAQRHEPVIVSVAASGRRAAPELVEVLDWRSYAVADVTVEGKAVGLVHAARADSDPEVDELDLELTALYADGLAQAFERAVLREQLRRQLEQLQSAAQWINGQMLHLSREPTPGSTPDLAPDDGKLAELLTPRELDVLRLVARGQSNRAIATSLVLGEGTVKYHVKNILRKLQARSRTEAVSRYMRLYGGSDGP